MPTMSRREEQVEGIYGPLAQDDLQPTSKREIVGWYCYGWAAEVFTVCAMGRFYRRHWLDSLGCAHIHH